MIINILLIACILFVITYLSQSKTTNNETIMERIVHRFNGLPLWQKVIIFAVPTLLFMASIFPHIHTAVEGNMVNINEQLNQVLEDSNE